jgi:hypothetical protein
MSRASMILIGIGGYFFLSAVILRFLKGAQRNRNRQCEAEQYWRARNGMRPPLTGIEEEAIRFDLITKEIEEDYRKWEKTL